MELTILLGNIVKSRVQLGGPHPSLSIIMHLPSSMIPRDKTIVWRQVVFISLSDLSEPTKAIFNFQERSRNDLNVC